MMLTHLKQQRNCPQFDLLISGYTRQYYGKHIIDDIDVVLKLFYNEVMHITFDEQAIDQIKNELFDAKIYGKGSNATINIKGYKFGCFIECDELYIYTEKDQFPSNWNDYKLNIHYEVYCNELNKGDIGMPYDITKEDYDDEQCVTVWLMTIGNDIPTDIKSLSFKIFIDIINISYTEKESVIKHIMYETVKLSNKINYEWIINEELMQKLRKAGKMKTSQTCFFSDNFGLNQEIDAYNQYGFCLELIPGDLDKDIIDIIKIRFLHLPKGVNRVKADVIITNGSGINQQCLDADFATTFWNNLEFEFKAQKSDKFTVNIDINQVYIDNMDYPEVVASDWNKYEIHDD